jgi:phosphoribosylformylglycinamidine cyclo-ligase
MARSKPSAYAAAGVDIDVMMDALSAAKSKIRRTATAGVVREVGSFGGLFRAPGSDTLLVSSIDGVGTKLKIAHRAGLHHTVGRDLVNHCVNDILTQGASPLFFMDYIGAARLEPAVFAAILDGLCKACRDNGCALLGGETAEMPGLYPDGEYDLVGTIVGAVKRKRLITGEKVRAGDVLIGLKSSGLHTNGYSLARKVLFEQAGLDIDDVFPGTRRRVDDVLLRVHKSYLKPVSRLLKQVKVKGMAHITGGGLVDNVPRTLPDGLGAEIDIGRWGVPPVFRFIADAGGVDREEMYRVFNMGIGMVVIVRPHDAGRAEELLRKAGERPARIGHVRRGIRGVQLVGV